MSSQLGLLGLLGIIPVVLVCCAVVFFIVLRARSLSNVDVLDAAYINQSVAHECFEGLPEAVKREGWTKKHPVIFIPGAMSSRMRVEHSSVAPDFNGSMIWASALETLPQKRNLVVDDAAAPINWALPIPEKQAERLRQLEDDPQSIGARCALFDDNRSFARMLVEPLRNRWLRHMTLIPPYNRDPDGIRVRPLSGTAGADRLDHHPMFGTKPGLRLCYVGQAMFNMLDALGYRRDIEYDALPWDWRICIPEAEARDGTLTTLANMISRLKATTGERVVVVSHSQGGRIIVYFAMWMAARHGEPGVRWLHDHIQSVVPFGGGFGGSTKGGRCAAVGMDQGLSALLFNHKELWVLWRCMMSTVWYQPSIHLSGPTCGAYVRDESIVDGRFIGCVFLQPAGRRSAFFEPARRARKRAVYASARRSGAPFVPRLREWQCELNVLRHGLRVVRRKGTLEEVVYKYNRFPVDTATVPTYKEAVERVHKTIARVSRCDCLACVQRLGPPKLGHPSGLLSPQRIASPGGADIPGSHGGRPLLTTAPVRHSILTLWHCPVDCEATHVNVTDAALVNGRIPPMQADGGATSTSVFRIGKRNPRPTPAAGNGRFAAHSAAIRQVLTSPSWGDAFLAAALPQSGPSDHVARNMLPQDTYSAPSAPAPLHHGKRSHLQRTARGHVTTAPLAATGGLNGRQVPPPDDPLSLCDVSLYAADGLHVIFGERFHVPVPRAFVEAPATSHGTLPPLVSLIIRSRPARIHKHRHHRVRGRARVARAISTKRRRRAAETAAAARPLSVHDLLHAPDVRTASKAGHGVVPASCSGTTGVTLPGNRFIAHDRVPMRGAAAAVVGRTRIVRVPLFDPDTLAGHDASAAGQGPAPVGYGFVALYVRQTTTPMGDDVSTAADGGYGLDLPSAAVFCRPHGAAVAAGAASAGCPATDALAPNFKASGRGSWDGFDVVRRFTVDPSLWNSARAAAAAVDGGDRVQQAFTKADCVAETVLAATAACPGGSPTFIPPIPPPPSARGTIASPFDTPTTPRAWIAPSSFDRGICADGSPDGCGGAPYEDDDYQRTAADAAGVPSYVGLTYRGVLAATGSIGAIRELDMRMRDNVFIRMLFCPPPIRRMVCVVGVGIDTEAVDFLRHRTTRASPALATVKFDDAADLIPQCQLPPGMIVHAGIGYETIATPQRLPDGSFARSCGDGTINYQSLTYPRWWSRLFKYVPGDVASFFDPASAAIGRAPDPPVRVAGCEASLRNSAPTGAGFTGTMPATGPGSGDTVGTLAERRYGPMPDGPQKLAVEYQVLRETLDADRRLIGAVDADGIPAQPICVPYPLPEVVTVELPFAEHRHLLGDVRALRALLAEACIPPGHTDTVPNVDRRALDLPTLVDPARLGGCRQHIESTATIADRLRAFFSGVHTGPRGRLAPGLVLDPDVTLVPSNDRVAIPNR